MLEPGEQRGAGARPHPGIDAVHLHCCSVLQVEPEIAELGLLDAGEHECHGVVVALSRAAVRPAAARGLEHCAARIDTEQHARWATALRPQAAHLAGRRMLVFAGRCDADVVVALASLPHLHDPWLVHGDRRDPTDSVATEIRQIPTLKAIVVERLEHGQGDVLGMPCEEHTGAVGRALMVRAILMDDNGVLKCKLWSHPQDEVGTIMTSLGRRQCNAMECGARHRPPIRRDAGRTGTVFRVGQALLAGRERLAVRAVGLPGERGDDQQHRCGEASSRTRTEGRSRRLIATRIA